MLVGVLNVVGKSIARHNYAGEVCIPPNQVQQANNLELSSLALNVPSRKTLNLRASGSIDRHAE